MSATTAAEHSQEHSQEHDHGHVLQRASGERAPDRTTGSLYVTLLTLIAEELRAAGEVYPLAGPAAPDHQDVGAKLAALCGSVRTVGSPPLVAAFDRWLAARAAFYATSARIDELRRRGDDHLNELLHDLRLQRERLAVCGGRLQELAAEHLDAMLADRDRVER